MQEPKSSTSAQESCMALSSSPGLDDDGFHARQKSKETCEYDLVPSSLHIYIYMNKNKHGERERESRREREREREQEREGERERETGRQRARGTIHGDHKQIYSDPYIGVRCQLIMCSLLRIRSVSFMPGACLPQVFDDSGIATE